MTKTPFDLTFEELAAAGARASDDAVKKAERAKVRIARFSQVGPTKRPIAPPLPAVLREEAHGGATVLTLGAHMCKWPIGDPSTEGFTFCGRGTVDETAYCAVHFQMAYGAAPGAVRDTVRSPANARSPRARKSL